MRELISWAAFRIQGEHQGEENERDNERADLASSIQDSRRTSGWREWERQWESWSHEQHSGFKNIRVKRVRETMRELISWAAFRIQEHQGEESERDNERADLVSSIQDSRRTSGWRKWERQWESWSREQHSGFKNIRVKKVRETMRELISWAAFRIQGEHQGEESERDNEGADLTSSIQDSRTSGWL